MSEPAFELGRLKSVGIETCGQALLWLPYRYDDFRRIGNRINPDGAKQNAILTVMSSTPDRENKYKTNLVVFDGDITAKISAFGDARTWQKLGKGDKIAASFESAMYGNTLYLKNVELIPREWVGSILPRYRGKEGVLSENTVLEKTRLALSLSLEETISSIMDRFPECRSADNLSRLAGIGDIRRLLLDAHAPGNMRAANEAIAELRKLAAFEPVYRGRLARSMMHPIPESSINITAESLNSLMGKLPFKLSNGQRQSIIDIVRDIKSTMPMRRLLSGDVGTGKTATFLLPCAAAALSGARVAILVPNELISAQVANEARNLFGVTVSEVCGSVKMKAADIAKTQLFVGTTALLSMMKKHDMKFDLVVIDEQQKFSREQRAALLSERTNLIEATATCIPRTMALVTHGGMEVSTLGECPVKKDIKSKLIGSNERAWLYNEVASTMNAGRQCVIVYPAINAENERDGVEGAFELWNGKFPGKVASLHGKLKDDEKRNAIEAFKAGEINMLVTTSIIEIGITLPSLELLVVTSPDRFGSSTLHQYRGRIARNGGAGRFYMYLSKPLDEVDPETIERLRIVENTNNGFTIAEQDLALRGFGDLSHDSDDQSGAFKALFFKMKIKPEDIMQFLPQQEKNDEHAPAHSPC